MEGSPLPRRTILTWVLGGAGLLGAFGLLAGAFDGPDWGAYAVWSNAFHNSDLFRIPSTTGSPLGLPVSQWSHGPGLTFAAGRLVIDAFTPHLVAGWLSAVLFWWLAWVIFRELAPGGVLLPIAGLGLLFVGTHAGFYSLAHASESLSLAPIALLVWLALRRAGLEPVDALWVGVATASLILVRSYLAVYALPAMVRLLLALRGRKPGVWFQAGLLAAAPMAVALAQTAFVNRWMTGSSRRSVYVFGDEGFRSLDFAHPELAAVLVHPLRGLLVYHPLYAVGFLALLALLFVPRGTAPACPALDEEDRGGAPSRLAATAPDGSAGSRRPGAGSIPRPGVGSIARPIVVAMAIAVLLNLWVQAAWYVWWLGGRTFGMRGMVGAALPLVAALVAGLAILPHRARIAALGSALAAAVWSFPFLMRGIPGALSWRGVFATAADFGAAVLREHGLALLAGAAVGFVLLRWLAAEPRSTSLQATASMLASAVAVYLYELAGVTPAVEIGSRVFGAALLLLLFGCLLAAAAPAWTRPGQIAGLVMLVALAAGAVLFVPLARDTETALRDGTLLEPGFTDQAPFLVQEIRASYAEYLSIPGFEDKKQALHDFLQRGGFIP